MTQQTLCFTGFSREEAEALQAKFATANARFARPWQLAPEMDAAVLVIDMDSMYGHMTWLKAADSGKKTVGVTAGERCETDFMVKSPMTADSLRGLLVLLAANVPPASARMLAAIQSSNARRHATGSLATASSMPYCVASGCSAARNAPGSPPQMIRSRGRATAPAND